MKKDTPHTLDPQNHDRGLVHTSRMRGNDRSQALRAMTMGRTVVYAMRLKGGIIKIGCSGDLARRRSMLAVGAEILAFRFGDFDDEKAIHDSLKAHRARGREYYHPTPEVLAVVNDMRDDFGLPHIAA